MTDTILVEPLGEEPAQSTDPHQDLVLWIKPKVEQWRDVRETTYRDKWDEFYHIWRGRWTSKSKSRKTERSKVIAPASQIAVDTAAAELLEALFAREQFADLSDNIDDEQKEDALIVRDRLMEDLKNDGIIETMAEICTIGALYGQFIAKIVTEVETVSRPQLVDVQMPDGSTQKELRKITEEKVKVYPVAIEPGNLVPDPSASRVQYMLGIAHEFKMPRHLIEQRQSSGVYFDKPIGDGESTDYTQSRSEEDGTADGVSPTVDIVEWHGYVPTRLLTLINSDGDELIEEIAETSDDSSLTDAIVTIANGNVLLRAIPNPSVMEDRAIVAEQFDTVPNRFWGRGVMEKGYNMQKSLDSELRARQDGLAWTNNPMIAGDITALPPGANLDSWPGKYWGTKGDPRNALMPLQFGAIDAATFQQAADLERMLQFATGAVDPSILNGGVRDQATGASAVNVSGIVKRNKRTMLNMEAFMTRLLRGIVWRKMKFDPDRYPADYEFVVRGTVGIMAREVEQQFLIQMVQFAPQASPEQAGLLKLIIEESASPRKRALLQLLDQRMQGPTPEQQQKAEQQEQLQQQIIVETIRNKQADTAKKLADAGLVKSKELLTKIETELLDDQMILDSVRLKVDISEAQNQAKQISISERKQDLEELKFARGN